MSEDKEKKIHANEESGEEVEAHVKRGGRELNDEGGADQGEDDVQAHVKTRQ
jgi:hypothetical protein